MSSFLSFEQMKHVHSRSLLVYKFFGLHLILGKNTSIFGEAFFLGLHLISEKKHQFSAKTFSC